MQVPFGVVRERDGRIAASRRSRCSASSSAPACTCSRRRCWTGSAGHAISTCRRCSRRWSSAACARGCHTVDGYWLDIGRLPDYERANVRFHEECSDDRTRKVLALIPARGGSKGLPGKNILSAGGRPLLALGPSKRAEARGIVDRLSCPPTTMPSSLPRRRAAARCRSVRPAELATDTPPASIVVAARATICLATTSWCCCSRPRRCAVPADIDAAWSAFAKRCAEPAFCEAGQTEPVLDVDDGRDGRVQHLFPASEEFHAAPGRAAHLRG